MKALRFRSGPIFCCGLILGAALAAGRGYAEPPGKKRVDEKPVTPQKARASSGDAMRLRPAHAERSYVRARRDYSHVRVARPHRRDDGRLDVRPIIVRSARVTPVVLDRFEDRRRDQLRLVIQQVKEGRQDRAIEIWATFVEGLRDDPEPVDLDDVMLLIARESCLHDNDAYLFRSARLEFLSESSDRLEDYVDSLSRQREACLRRARHCSTGTIRDLDTEIARTRGEREILEIQIHQAGAEFDRVVAASREVEQRFAATYEDLYREVELRIRFSP